MTASMGTRGGSDARPGRRVPRTARAFRVGLAVLPAIGQLVCSASASASGFLNPVVSDPHGQPDLANVYAVDFNPAALGGLRGTNVVLDGSLAVSYIAFDRTAPLSNGPSNTPSSPTWAAYVASNTGKNTAANAGFFPFVGASSDFGSRSFFAGIAVYAPFGGSIKWQQASRWANDAAVPGAVDGPQRWQSVSVVDATVATTAALGARVLDERLSFGAALTVYSHTVKLNKAFNNDGSDDITGPTGVLKEGRAYLDVSGVNVGASFGVYYEADRARRLRLGASYTSQPGFGVMHLPGTLEQRLGITPSGTTDVDLVQSYPDIVRLGAAYRVSDDVDLRLHGQYVRWSVFTNACLVHRGMPCDLERRRVGGQAGADHRE